MKMEIRQRLFVLSALILGLIAGAIIGSKQLQPTDIEGAVDAVEDKTTKPAYLIGAVSITNPQKLPEYRAVAEPLAHRLGGYQVLGSGMANKNAILLEGRWPAEGLFFIERYDSMDGLQAFVNSHEFQRAKELRDQVARVHFMIAVEGGDNVPNSQ